MFNKIKIWLWKVSLWPEFKCPVCGKELIDHGNDPDKYFTCKRDDCRFNKND